MHELSIATDLINTAIATAKQNNAKKVLSITVEIGELALVNPKIFPEPVCRYLFPFQDFFQAIPHHEPILPIPCIFVK